jgi:hypothetical protein
MRKKSALTIYVKTKIHSFGEDTGPMEDAAPKNGGVTSKNCGTGAKWSDGVLKLQTHIYYEPYTTRALRNNMSDVDLYNAHCANETVHE